MTEGRTPVIARGEIRGAHRALRVWHDTRWGVRELGRTIALFPADGGGVCRDESKDEDWQKAKW